MELPKQNPTAAQIKAYKEWNQGSRKVLYWLFVSVQDTMIGHIQDANSPKEAWDSLLSLDTTNTKARKLQLKYSQKGKPINQRLHIENQRHM